jgi:hypothetical protein
VEKQALFATMLSTVGSDLKEFYVSIGKSTLEQVRTGSNVLKEVPMNVLCQLDDLVMSPEMALFSWDREDVMQEAQLRMDVRSVYTTPLLDEDWNDSDEDDEKVTLEVQLVRDFFKTFNIVEKTGEISDLLETHPNLQVYFQELVPVEVSYEDFWARFFFRCDPDRIEKVWKAQDERVRLARSKRFTSIKSKLQKPITVMVKPLKTVANPIKTVVTSVAGKMEFKSTKGPSTDSVAVSTKQIKLLNEALTVSNVRIHTLRDKLEETKQRLAQAERRVGNMKADLDNIRNRLEGSSIDSLSCASTDMESSLEDSSDQSVRSGDMSSVAVSPAQSISVVEMRNEDYLEEEWPEDGNEVSFSKSVLDSLKTGTASIGKLAGFWTSK